MNRIQTTAFALLLASAVSGSPSPKPLSRQDFTTRLAAVRITAGERADQDTVPASTELEVTRLLGKPDDVVVYEEDELLGGTYGASLQPGERRLCYGTAEHRGLPTLGWVIIDVDHRVRWVAGAVGAPPSPTLMPEPELRNALRIIHEAPDQPYRSQNWDAAHLIRVVNFLQLLGSDRALAALREYARVTAVSFGNGIRVTGTRNSLFAILCTLYSVPQPDHSGFELLVQDGIPFLVAPPRTYSNPESFQFRRVDFYRTHGAFLDKPLSPGPNPFRSADTLFQSGQWRNLVQGDIERDLEMRRSVMMQAVRLVAHPTEDEQLQRLTQAAKLTDLENAWRSIPGRARDRRWNGKTNSYGAGGA